MTLGEFRKLTEGWPDNLDLFVNERITDFKYGLVESVKRKEIPFSEEPGGKTLSTDEVIVLSED